MKNKLKPETVVQRVRDIDVAIKVLKEDAEKIKSRCSHKWQYEYDPSGNNDGGYYCSGCGSWTRIIPKGDHNG